MVETPRRQDGVLLHFLKELPAWCVISQLIIVFLAAWFVTQADFIPRIIDALLGGLMTSIVGQVRRQPPTTQIDTVKTDSVATSSMDNAAITTDSINVRPQDETKENNDG